MTGSGKTHHSTHTVYIAGNFRGVLIFVIFMVCLKFLPTNFSTHVDLICASARCCTRGTLACTRTTYTMALFRYLRPVDGALDLQGPLSKTVPSVMIREVYNEVKRVEMRLPKK